MPSTREIFKILIEELNEELVTAAQLPMPDIGEDEPAIVSVDVEGTELLITHMPRSAQLCLCCRLDPLPEDAATVMRLLLEFNQLNALNGGPFFGRDLFTGNLMLNVGLDLYGIDGAGLVVRLEALLTIADHWKQGRLPEVKPLDIDRPNMQGDKGVGDAT